VLKNNPFFGLKAQLTGEKGFTDATRFLAHEIRALITSPAHRDMKKGL
jgi:hypothetical protein